MTTHKPALLPVEDALQQLLAAAQPLNDVETLPLSSALHRILADAVMAPLDVPGFDNSAMDGYALRVADLGAGPLPVSQRVAAGQTAAALQPGTVARIFTGAPVPAGADAVVMQEQCELLADGQVHIAATVTAGQNVRQRGEDMAAGSCVLEAGTRLRPQELGLLASLGLADVRVRRQPRVAVFFTGDELVEPGQPLGPGQIYNSNRYMVVALLQEAGCQVTDLGIVRDALEATRTALREAAEAHDVVLTCGGVSVGEEDHVKAAVQAEGTLQLWQIAIKPGKPLAWGRVGNAHFFGLPGNPVSSFVTFKVLVQPFLQALAGGQARPLRLQVKSAFGRSSPERRREYLRVRLENGPQGTVAAAYPQQGSGVLTSCCFADGLLDVAPGQTFAAGDELTWQALDN